jgi:hypothetical protein
MCEKCGKQFCWGILYGVTCPWCGWCEEYKCERCSGSGIADCENCDGRVHHAGSVEYKDCDYCRGTGRFTCLDCDGKGCL